MVLNKLSLTKAFIHLQPDLRYLVSLLKATKYKEQEYKEQFDWIPALMDILFLTWH